MNKLLLPSVVVLLLPLAFGCSSPSSEDEPEVNYISTTIRATPFFTEVGSEAPIDVITVGKTYAVNVAPFSKLSPELAPFVEGSVKSCTYVLGGEVMGVSTSEPFSITYTVPARMEGQQKLTVAFDLSPNDHNKWVEVEGLVTVVPAE